MTTATFLLSLLLAQAPPPVGGPARPEAAGVSSFPLADEPRVVAYDSPPERVGERALEDLEEEDEHADLPGGPSRGPDLHSELLRLARPAVHFVARARIRSPRSPPTP